MATLITTLIPSGGLVMQASNSCEFNILFQGINGLGFLGFRNMCIHPRGMDNAFASISRHLFHPWGLNESKC